MKVHVLEPAEMAWWYEELLGADFPANERKPLENILSLHQRGKYDVYLYEDEAVMGYATIWKLAGRTTFLLDYLGVPASRRNQGLGGVLLQDIRQRVIDRELGTAAAETDFSEPADTEDFCLVLESEVPVEGDTEEANAMRLRRIGFYERNGYIPLYEMGTCGMRFQAFSYQVMPKDLARVMKDHKEIYGPERTDVIVPLPAGMTPPLPFWMKD